MARKKKGSVTQSLQILFTPMNDDKRPLAAIETEMMRVNKKTDCTDIDNAEIIRYCIHTTYEILKKKK